MTAPASADLAALHHRVPVTISPQDFEFWLDCRSDSAEAVTPLMRGPEDGEFVWHEVSVRVNQVANDDAQLVLPITDEQREAEQQKPARKPSPRKVVAAPDDGQGRLF